uniref:Uncharacterized protein n=1 Tax=Gopherus agassizii TaxID=38772 RepID=A0A452H5H7_9SAUR
MPLPRSCWRGGRSAPLGSGAGSSVLAPAAAMDLGPLRKSYRGDEEVRGGGARGRG